MFRFFRKIRYKLLDEGHLGKYTSYAIGEILLVVIGILIALQINNWNESRIEEELSDQYLSGLIKDLQADVELFSGVKNTGQKRLSRGLILRDIYNGYEPTNEELVEILITLRLAGFTYRAQVNDNTFQALKSSGNLRLLPSAILRDKLFSYYGYLSQAKQWSYITEKNQLDYTDALKDIRTIEQADAWFAGEQETVSVDEGKLILGKIRESNTLKKSLAGVITNQRNFISESDRAIDLAKQILELLGAWHDT